MTLDSAKTYGVIAVVVLVIAAIAGAWLMNTLLQKLLTFAALGLLAFAVWTQRGALQDCADKVSQSFDVAETANRAVTGQVDNECSFFGVTVTVPPPSAPSTP